MTVTAPHFLLYAEAARPAGCDDSDARRWRFVLRSPAGETTLEAADEEHEAGIERLELLAVVRGLEALSQPSRITLLTGSRHLRRGLESGITQWRENDWQWERYGRMTPIKNRDLWRRLDRLVEIHAVQCSPGRLDPADDLSPAANHRTRTGRKLRIDQPSGSRGKFQASSTKAQTNLKPVNSNDASYPRLGHSRFLTWCLFEIWFLMLGVLSGNKSSTPSRSHRKPSP